jgi:hypothetical protein
VSEELEHQEDELDVVDDLDHAARAKSPGGRAEDGSREPWLQPWDRSLLVSKTRSGKSSVLLVFASYFTNSRILFIDVKRRYVMPDAVVVQGVDELYALDPTKLPWRIHFLPIATNTVADPRAEEREWEGLFRWCEPQTDLAVIVDECVPKPLPANGYPGPAEKVAGQKKVDRVGFHAATGRWRGMARFLIGHADHIMIWPKGLSVDELDDVAREMALGDEDEHGRRVKPTTELRRMLRQAEQHGPFAFLWWDRNRDLFRIMQLPPHLLERAIAVEVEP